MSVTQNTTSPEISPPLTEVVFYVLNSDAPEARDRFISKLVHKIHTEKRRADILFETLEDAQRFDIALWQYQPQSFIPHAIAQETTAPIQLFGRFLGAPCQDILLNCHPDFPNQFQQYQRTIEVLDQTEYLIQKGRERFKHYRSLNIEPLVHKIGF